MTWNRNVFIIVGFSISFVVCLFTAVPLLAQESSWGAWVGMVIGGSLGVWSCLYLFRAIRRSKANSDRNSQNIKSNTNYATSRWMIISAIGGMFLARLVSNTVDPVIQSLINKAVAMWIITSFGGATFLIWRYLPKDWKSS